MKIICELREAVAALTVQVQELQTNGINAGETWATVAGRGSRQQGSRSATPQTNPNSNSNTGRRRAGNGNRNRGHGGTNPRGGASHQDGRVQPNPRTGEPPKTNSQGEGLSNEGPTTQIQTDSQRVNGTLVSQNNTLDPGVNTDTQKVRVSGVRRIWGTVKSCSSGAVKNTVSNLVSPEAVPQIGNMVVKRKYKRLPGNKIRWWFLIYMEEDSLEKLESAWERVSLQTSWKLEPCHAPGNFSQAPPLPPQT